jgi:hypothetical protein
MNNLFIALFEKAGLTEKEKMYFMDDLKDALSLGYASPEEYYSNKETQFCLTNYAHPSYAQIAKNGLNKILTVL